MSENPEDKPKVPQYSTNWYIDILRDEDPERAEEEIAKLSPREHAALKAWDDEQLVLQEERRANRANSVPTGPIEHSIPEPESADNVAARQRAEAVLTHEIEQLRLETDPDHRKAHEAAVVDTIREAQGAKVCRINGCPGGVFARGLCSKHYHRARQQRSMKDPVKHETCGEAGCDSINYSKGYCQLHYMRRWRAGEFEKKPLPDSSAKECRINGCGRKYYAKLYCRYHYDKFRRPELNGLPPGVSPLQALRAEAESKAEAKILRADLPPE